MTWPLYLLWGLLLAVLVYEDFKERAISWWPLLGILGLGVYQLTQSIFWEAWFLAFNLIFIVLQLLLVSLYFSFKAKRWVNICKAHLGIGDILFFFALCPAFAPTHFCTCFIGSLLFTLVGSILYQQCFRPLKTVPLAGGMSLGIFLYYTGCLFWAISPYNDWPLIAFIYGV